MEWSIDALSSGFSVEDASEAAKEIFSESNASFEEIKNRPWYKSLLNTVTFRQGDKRLMVRNVRNLANLQSLFMEVYINELRNQDARLDAIVRDIRSTQEAVEQLYCKCVLHLKPQEDISSLEETDQQRLLLLLSEFDRTRCLTEEERGCLQQYNSAVARALTFNRPYGSLEPDMLELVGTPAVFYRCVLEQCAVTGRLEPLQLPENMEEAVDYLDISNRKKNEAKAAVQAELDDYGANWFFMKYSKQGSILDERDFIFAGDELEEKGPSEEDQMNEEFDVPKDPVQRIAWEVDRRAGLLGVPLLIDRPGQKSQMIAQLLPNVLPVSKTVSEITKLNSGHLVFTTCALYWVTNEQVCRIPYAEINRNSIGTKAVGRGTAFIYAPDGWPEVEIQDANLNAAELESALLDICTIGEFPESDTLTDFSDLPLEIRLAYMQILVGIIWENGLSLHEVFRIAVRRSMEPYWKEICQEPEILLEDAICNFTAQIPYPNEEALTISLLQDICIAYQYTKDTDILTAEEKKYFALIHSGQDSSIDSIVRYAQMEKQMIEGRIEPQKVKETSDAFGVAAGAVGASVLTYAGAWTLFASTLWFNFIPGIGTLLSAGIAGAAIAKKFLASKRDTSVSDAETRQEMRVEVISDYKQSEQTASDLGFDEIAARLRESAHKIAGRIGVHYDDYTEAERELLQEIRCEIVSFMQGDQEQCTAKKQNSNAKLTGDLSNDGWEKVLSNLTFSSSKVGVKDIIGLYDPTFSGAIFGNFMGILFLQNGIYYRRNKSSPIQWMSYLDMVSIDEKLMSTIICGKNGNTITLNSINYINVQGLLQKIVKMVAGIV